MKNIESISEISKTGTTLLVVGTDWCKYCGSTYKAIDEVMPNYPEIEVVKIDGDENPEALIEVGGKTFPQLVLFNNGEKLAQRESAKAEALQEWLKANI